MKIYFLLICIVLTGCKSATTPTTNKEELPQTITSYEAKNYVGKTMTVCGVVAVNKHERPQRPERGKPQFLNLDKPYPFQHFSIVFWNEDLRKFSYNLRDLWDKKICIHGVIETYNGSTPAIEATEPSQITIQP